MPRGKKTNHRSGTHRKYTTYHTNREETVGEAADNRRKLIVALFHVVTETIQDPTDGRHIEERVHRRPDDGGQHLGVQVASRPQSAHVEGQRGQTDGDHCTGMRFDMFE